MKTLTAILFTVLMVTQAHAIDGPANLRAIGGVVENKKTHDILELVCADPSDANCGSVQLRKNKAELIGPVITTQKLAENEIREWAHETAEGANRKWSFVGLRITKDYWKNGHFCEYSFTADRTDFPIETCGIQGLGVLATFGAIAVFIPLFPVNLVVGALFAPLIGPIVGGAILSIADDAVVNVVTAPIVVGSRIVRNVKLKATQKKLLLAAEVLANPEQKEPYAVSDRVFSMLSGGLE